MQVQRPERIPQKDGVLDRRLVRSSLSCSRLPMSRHSGVTMHVTVQGISNKTAKCETCGQLQAECTGHYGAHHAP